MLRNLKVAKFDAPHLIMPPSMIDSAQRMPGLRRRNPAVPGMGEQLEWSLYDSFSVAAAAAFPKTTLFQTPIGSGGKTLASTNIRANGKLANGESFKVRQLRCFIANDTVPGDVNLIQRNVSIVFRVRNKTYFEGIPVLLPAGAGNYVTAAAQLGVAPAGSAPIFSSSNGSLDPRSGYIFDEPGIVITPEENIDLTLTAEVAFNLAAAGANPAGVGTTIYLFLDGVIYRGVN